MKQFIPKIALSAMITTVFAFTASISTVQAEEPLPEWVENQFESEPLAPTQLRHLPEDTQIRVSKNIVIPPYEERIVYSTLKEEIEVCGKTEKNNIRAMLRFHPSRKERVIPAGSLLKIGLVEQELVHDKFADPKRFVWYKLTFKDKDIRYMTLKIYSKRWGWFGRWNKIKSCGALKGFLADDLSPLSGGHFQVFNMPSPSTIGRTPSVERNFFQEPPSSPRQQPQQRSHDRAPLHSAPSPMKQQTAGHYSIPAPASRSVTSQPANAHSLPTPKPSTSTTRSSYTPSYSSSSPGADSVGLVGSKQAMPVSSRPKASAVQSQQDAEQAFRQYKPMGEINSASDVPPTNQEIFQ